eukprot:425366_1
MRYQRMHRNTFERQKTSKRQCVHRIPPHKSPPLTQGSTFINAASTEHLRGPFLDTKPCFGWTFDVQKHVVLSVCNPTWLSSIQFISFPAFHHHIGSTSRCSCVLDGRATSPAHHEPDDSLHAVSVVDCRFVAKNGDRMCHRVCCHYAIPTHAQEYL